MRHPSIQGPPPSRVMAIFETGATVFQLARSATIAELAVHLARLAGQHDGALVSVEIRVDQTRTGARAKTDHGGHARANDAVAIPPWVMIESGRRARRSSGHRGG